MESLQAQLVAVEGGTQERKELKMLQKVIRNLEVEYTFTAPILYTLHVFIALLCKMCSFILFIFECCIVCVKVLCVKVWCVCRKRCCKRDQNIRDTSVKRQRN